MTLIHVIFLDRFILDELNLRLLLFLLRVLEPKGTVSKSYILAVESLHWRNLQIHTRLCSLHQVCCELRLEMAPENRISLRCGAKVEDLRMEFSDLSGGEV